MASDEGQRKPINLPGIHNKQTGLKIVSAQVQPSGSTPFTWYFNHIATDSVVQRRPFDLFCVVPFWSIFTSPQISLLLPGIFAGQVSRKAGEPRFLMGTLGTCQVTPSWWFGIGFAHLWLLETADAFLVSVPGKLRSNKREP